MKIKSEKTILETEFNNFKNLKKTSNKNNEVSSIV
jgi:hypothetical protein